jgi:long-chain acyl-CoA synthetase
MSELQVRSGDTVRPLATVRERAARLAGALADLGVEHGDRYAIVMRNEVTFLEASLAASVIGAVPVPINWHWSGADLRHVLEDSGSKIVIAHSDFVPAVESQAPAGTVIIEAEVPDEVAQPYRLGVVPLTGRHVVLEDLIPAREPITVPTNETPMGVIYTSGTTGRPKGVLRNRSTPEDQQRILKAAGVILKLTPNARTLLPAPLYHAAPNSNAMFAVGLGMDITIMPRFDAEEFLRLVQEHRIETVQMVPTMFHRLLQLPKEVRDSYDVSSLTAIVHAAAPCPIETKKAMIDWLGPVIFEYYGGSEAGIWTFCDSHEALAHPGSVGRPILGSDIRILDGLDQPVPTGTPGVIYGKSIDGWPDFTYLGQDDKRREIERDGYVTVGDIGYLDEDGFLYLSDRVSDMVISGGVNIYPAEIEGCLWGMEGVADVAVFGIPDAEYGESLAAHLQLLPGARVSADDVRAFVEKNLAKYKVPRVVVFDDELPRDDSGKLYKRSLKALYQK